MLLSQAVQSLGWDCAELSVLLEALSQQLYLSLQVLYETGWRVEREDWERVEDAFTQHRMKCLKFVMWTLKFPRPPKLHETHKHHACLPAHHGISGMCAGAWYRVAAQLIFEMNEGRALRVVERKEPGASLVVQ